MIRRSTTVRLAPRRLTLAAVAVAASLGGLVALAGCSSVSPETAADSGPAPSALAGLPSTAPADPSLESASSAEASTALVTREPWVYEGNRGETIRTPHYEINTTIEYSQVVDRLPTFMEAALEHYRSELGDLPAPTKPMVSWVFGDRDQWESKTVEVIPSQASQLRNLGRGGFSTRGQAVLYYIDWAGRSRDTLAIAAHEGWHQYTQSTFEDPLPLWLEEGIATYMEGYRWRSADGPPEFEPRWNYERWKTLQRLVRRDRLIPLRELVSKSPQEFLAEGKGDLLAYYAQVWGLTRFLVAHEDGAYLAGLQEAVKDAAEGRLIRRLASSQKVRALGGRRQALRGRFGPWILHEYITDDIVEFEKAYEAYCRELTRWRGRSRRG